MAPTLSPMSVNMIKSLAPAFKSKGTALFKKFFEILYARYPSFKTMFLEENVNSGKQIKAMSEVFTRFVMNPDNLSVLEERTSAIVGRHVNLGVEATHYPLVGECLLDAIKDVLKDECTDATLQAWSEGFTILSNFFISLENEFKKNPYYTYWKLSEETILILKESADEIKRKGTAISTHLFATLFERFPVFRVIFPKDNTASGKMIAALPHALTTFAANCDNVGALQVQLHRIAISHVTNAVQEWHFPLLEECLLEAIGANISPTKFPLVAGAWKEGYRYLANEIRKLEDIKRVKLAAQHFTPSDDTFNTIKASADSFKARGTEIFTHFFDVLYERYPVFKGKFKEENVKSGYQIAAMLKVFHTFAVNGSDLSPLDQVSADVVGGHVNLGVDPSHYPLVGECLIEAIRVVLAPAPQVIDAWQAGYKFLSSYFITLEDEFRRNPYHKNWILSSDAIQALKASAPVLKAKGHAIATQLYSSLFSRYPVFRGIFPTDSTRKRKMIDALPKVLVSFAENSDNISAIDGTISKIANRHVDSGVQDWHYPMLEESLIDAFSKILGTNATPELLAYWRDGFRFLANRIMKLEAVSFTKNKLNL